MPPTRPRYVGPRNRACRRLAPDTSVQEIEHAAALRHDKAMAIVLFFSSSRKLSETSITVKPTETRRLKSTSREEEASMLMICLRNVVFPVFEEPNRRTDLKFWSMEEHALRCSL
ncbi:hypothetical protein AMTRI_Chr03g146660 [Amborella trichopoda]